MRYTRLRPADLAKKLTGRSFAAGVGPVIRWLANMLCEDPHFLRNKVGKKPI